MADTPKNASGVLYQKRCNCRNATAGTGRLKVNMNPERALPNTRELALSITLMDLVCNVCDTPWTSEVVEWVAPLCVCGHDEDHHVARAGCGEVCCGDEACPCEGFILLHEDDEPKAG